MKVYIVTSGDYSDYHIEAVFTNEEQANLYCALHAGRWDSPSVEEYETDTWQIETKNDFKVRWEDYFWSKNPYLMPNSKFATNDENSIEVIKKENSDYGNLVSGDYCKIVVTLDRTVTRQEVVKIMQDRIAAWKYEQAMEEEHK